MTRVVGLLSLLACGALAACSGADDGAPSSPPAEDPSGGCGAGLRRAADGACEPLLFEGDCPPGTRAAVGQAECVPVGWQDCPAGFEREASGWGCAPVLPAAACTGAKREAIGETMCVPIGDCAAAFPPAGARLFVSPTGPTDATHFQRISDALAASRAGDVIAIDDGTYAESLTVARAVTLAGRCPERVKIDGGTRTQPGIVSTAGGAMVRGVSISGWSDGASVERGSITFEDTVFADNADTGVTVVDGASAVLRRSAVRGTVANKGVSGFGVQAIFGAHVELVESVIAGSAGGNVLVGEAGSTIVVERSVIRDGQSDRNGQFGLGLNVTGKAKGEVRGSAILDNHRAGLRAGANAELVVADTVVRGTLTEGTGGVGMGLLAVDGAKVNVTGFAASANEGPAIAVAVAAHVAVERATLFAQKGDAEGDLASGGYVFTKSSLDLVDVAMVDNGRSGVDAFDRGTTLTMSRSLVARTRPSRGNKMGVGVAIAMGASGVVSDCTLVDNRHSGVYLWSGGSVDLVGTLVRGTQKEVFEDRLGHGILAQDAPRIWIDGSVLERSAGIGVALADSASVVRRSFIRANSVGIHVQDVTLTEGDATDGEVAPGEVLVSSDTVFVGNGAKVGSGALPLPQPPDVTSP